MSACGSALLRIIIIAVISIVLWMKSSSHVFADRLLHGVREESADCGSWSEKAKREKEIEEQKRVDGRRDMDEREYFGPSRIALKPEQLTNSDDNNKKLDLSAFVKKDSENQTQCTATYMANKIKEVSKAANKSSLPLNPSPYAYGSIPDNDILRVKGHSKGKFAVKWLKKGKSHIEIATADGTLYVIPITPEIVRVIFVKGIGVKPHKTYWKQKADTAFKWVAKESKSLIEIQTEKLILRIEKKNGAIQYFDADRNLLVSENATEPRLLNNGECYTFFDWDKSEKLLNKNVDNKYKKYILSFIELSGNYKDILKKLKSLIINKKMQKSYEELKSLSFVFELYNNFDKILLDFSIESQLGYYNGIIFKGYIKESWKTRRSYDND